MPTSGPDSPGFDHTTLPPPYEAIEGFDVLREMAPEFLRAMTREGDIYATYRGQTIIEEGERADRIFFLVQGKVSVQIESIAPNIEIGINRIGPGEIFGEMALLGERSRSATIVGREPCIVVSLNLEKVEALCRKHPDQGMIFFRNIAAVLAERVQEMNLKVLNMMRARYR
jgi:CRP-like cAMP-binding protein